MRFSAVLLLASLLTPLVGCSAYQSEGRKYLESNAFEFAGVKAQENLLGCGFDPEDASWSFVSSSPEADVLMRNGNGVYDLHVKSKAESPAFSCDYRFASDEERTGDSEDAVALTLEKYVSQNPL